MNNKDFLDELCEYEDEEYTEETKSYYGAYVVIIIVAVAIFTFGGK